MKRNFLTVALTNICLFVLITFVCFVIEFAAYGSSLFVSWVIFGGFVVIHLTINLLVIVKPKEEKLPAVLLSNLFILGLYSVVVFIYR